jgi:glycogen debranching enzyme
MPAETVSILDGNQFVVSNRQGDIEATPTDNHGLFLDDTRFLSRWVLTINGMRPKVLSVDETAYYQTQHFLALATGTTYVDSHLTVVRKRAVGGGFRERLGIVNHDQSPVDLDICIEVDADFADLFEVKGAIDKKGDVYRHTDDDGALTLGYQRERFHREVRITSSVAPETDGSSLRFHITLEPQAEWTTEIEVQAKRDMLAPPSNGHPRQLSEGAGDMSKSLQRWLTDAPKLQTSWPPLPRIYGRSLVDLAALRFRTAVIPGALPAAGLPWFMAIFGRDSLITSFQAIPFIPELASTTLRSLAILQARRDDPFRDAEPGKILHELRLGEMTAFEDTPHSPYYGTADATPLFLILLEEYDRWTGDHDLARELEREARAALAWIEKYGDRDGDGYIEYERRNPKGLENQCWKDSFDSIAFADGTLAKTPRATCELQGYAYDARRRTARLAREVWGEATWAGELERDAANLKRRFNKDFWLPERGFFALGLDGDKRPIDSLTSNIGHLLWSGIADEDKARSCVNHLMSDALFSGWGVRTMAATEGGYNPIGYHVGTVWPHDNSIVAWGLRRYGYRDEAARIAIAMLEAAQVFGDRLPEAFAGYPRETTKYPVEYPTACIPQAWATGAPMLLIRAMLGLESDGAHLLIDPALPEEIGQLALLDIPGPWGSMDAYGRARGASGNGAS